MTARPRRTSLWAMALAILSAGGVGTTRAQTPAEAPGVATVAVDAREAPRGIMSAHLELPVAAGPLTLVYPNGCRAGTPRPVP